MSAPTGSDPAARGADGPSSAIGPSAGAASAGAPPVAVAAIDLGATSGRVMLGIVGDGGIELVQARRFENGLVERDGHLSWDLDALWDEVRQGLAEAHDLAVMRGLAGLSSIGADSWAVDYVFVGPDGERIGEAIAYRDSRTDGVAAQLARRVGRARQFALTGIAQQPFNTIYQLAADDRVGALPGGTTALLLPDHLGFLLTGHRRTEITNASTTGLLEAGRSEWSSQLLDAAGIGADLFAPLVAPGQWIGMVSSAVAGQLGIGEVPVVTVGSHDTASAVFAVPARSDTDDGPVAYISSGTWSLIGLELSEPVATEAAREAGFTNEGGIDGTFRFLKNVAGMWLVSESLRQWQDEGADLGLEQLLSAAAAEPANRFRIDPTDPQFLPPGSMADRVVAAARATDGNDATPETPAQVVRCILESLAATYCDELRTACRLAGAPLPRRLHVVGGGSQNALLNQLTADALGIEVIAGPVEATALGNIAVQARALGAVPSGSTAIRELVRASVELEGYTPREP